MWKTVLFVVASFFLFLSEGSHVCAQDLPEKFYIEHHDIPGVIKSNIVSSLVQDEYNLLWVGTSGGLFRFDGNQFKQYRYSNGKGLSLENRQINSLLWDSLSHRLLIGTRMGGLLQFTYTANTITHVGSTAETINELAQTSDGRIWVTTPSGLFELINNSLHKIASAQELKSPVALLANGTDLLVGCVLQIAVYRQGKLIRKMPIVSEGRIFKSTNRVSAMMLDTSNKLWVGTENDGVLVYDLKSWQLTKELLPDDRPFFSRINSILQDKAGWIWILTKAEGLAVYNPLSNAMQYLRNGASEENTLSGNNCYSILQDKSGILWIGTNGSVNFFNPEQRKFEHFIHEPYNPNSLSDNMVRGIYEDSDGKLWVGTDGGYINIINRINEKIEQIKVTGKNLPITESVIPFCFAELDNNTMLIGSSIGLLVYTKKNRSFEYYKPTEDYIKSKRVRQLALFKDRIYGIVLGTFFWFDRKTNEYNVQSMKGGEVITVFKIQDEENIWIGSTGAVSLLHLPDKKLNTIRIPSDTSTVMMLNIESYGEKLLVSTLNHGFYSVVQKNDSLKVVEQITTNNGLVDNTVYATIADDSGNLWIPTNRGLTRLDKEKRYINYDVSEGLQAEEFNRLAQLKLHNGEIAMGGINGVNVINPFRIYAKARKAQPMIFSLTVRGLEEKEMPTLQEDSIELNNTESSFRIDFGISDHGKPNRYTAHYMLENYDETWSSTDVFGNANYSQIKPGKYIFKYRVTNTMGEQTETKLYIYLKPPFWMTWWFRLTLSLIVIGVAIASFKIRVTREKREKERLEQLLKIRTQEIEKSREQLASLNEKKDLIFSILSHDLRSPLTTLKGFLGLLIDNGDMFTKEELKKHAEQIRNSVSTSLDLIDNTLFWSLSQMGGIQRNPVFVNVAQLVRKVTELNQLGIERKNILLQVEVDPELSVWSDENMLYVTIRNLVSNALKFTPRGKSISLKAKKRGDKVEIVVNDEGVGMSSDYIQKLVLQEHPNIKKGTSDEKGTGLGIILCQQFLALNNGTLKIESEEGVGSTFTIVLPSEKE